MADFRLYSDASLSLWPSRVVLDIEGSRYFLQDVPGDGYCFFHCLSLASGASVADTYMYRNIICSHINLFFVGR